MNDWFKNRNGIDELSILGISLSFILLLINLKFKNNIVNIVANIFMLTFGVFRVLSKNIPARRKENNRFLEIIQPIKNIFQKEQSIVRCENCHKRLRLPKGKGKIRVTCPHCNHIFYYKS